MSFTLNRVLEHLECCITEDDKGKSSDSYLQTSV
jgi:hypothetical protein